MVGAVAVVVGVQTGGVWLKPDESVGFMTDVSTFLGVHAFISGEI